MTRAHIITSVTSLALFACGFHLDAQAQQGAIALLKDVEDTTVIILVDANHHELATLKTDKRRKSDLRLVPGGRQLSYHVSDENGALMRLVVVGLTGQILKDIAIEPKTDPPSFRPRFIQDIIWLSDRKFRVIGSINNWNCQSYDMDLESGAISNGLFGQGDFITSPDGKHTAYLGRTSGGPDEERYESVEIAVEGLMSSVGQPIVYRGLEKGVFRVVVGPIWSEDSKRIAFLQRMVSTDETAVAFLSIDGKSGRVAIPGHFDEDSSLTWFGDDLAVRDETEMLVVNHSQKRIVRASTALVTRVEVERQARRHKAETALMLSKLRKEFGAREAVALSEKE